VTVKAKIFSLSWKLFWRCGILKVDPRGRETQNREAGLRKIEKWEQVSAACGICLPPNPTRLINIADSKG
jgi:hypothetical protein